RRVRRHNMHMLLACLTPDPCGAGTITRALRLRDVGQSPGGLAFFAETLLQAGLLLRRFLRFLCLHGTVHHLAEHALLDRLPIRQGWRQRRWSYRLAGEPAEAGEVGQGAKACDEVLLHSAEEA